MPCGAGSSITPIPNNCPPLNSSQKHYIEVGGGLAAHELAWVLPAGVAEACVQTREVGHVPVVGGVARYKQRIIMCVASQQVLEYKLCSPNSQISQNSS